jgi:hypothetical protein
MNNDVLQILPVTSPTHLPGDGGIKVKPFGCCATLTPLVVVAEMAVPAPRECLFTPPRE